MVENNGHPWKLHKIQFQSSFKPWNHDTKINLIKVELSPSTKFEKWRKAVDSEECVSALFLDLSKAFDTINHDFLLAKLKAYGFSPNALKLMHSYLRNRKQQVQINNKFSSESTVIACVPQGSIDGPLTF